MVAVSTTSGTRLRRVAVAVMAATFFLAYGATTWAHHSYSMFDMQRVLEIKGTVKEFRYVNPHSWIILYTQGNDAAASEVTIEAGGPGYLAKYGWKRESLKPGDKITASVNPLRDGSVGGSLVKVVLEDGHELDARAPAAAGTK